MKTNREAPQRAIAHFALSLGLGLLLTSMLKAITLSDNFSRMAAEAEDTCSTVVWYVEGGYWRDDVEMYLSRAEHVLFPNRTAVTKNPVRAR